MRARPAVGRTAVAVTTVVLSSCSSGDDAAPGTTLDDSETLRTVAVPPERLSPFCEAINDLNERLDSAAPDADTGEMIVDTYSSIVDEVPAEIRDDFLSVLAGLQADPSGTANDTTTITSSTGAAPSLR